MPKRRILIGSIIILVCMSVLFAYAYHETENEATDMVAPVQEAILFPSEKSVCLFAKKLSLPAASVP